MKTEQRTHWQNSSNCVLPNFERKERGEKSGEGGKKRYLSACDNARLKRWSNPPPPSLPRKCLEDDLLNWIRRRLGPNGQAVEEEEADTSQGATLMFAVRPLRLRGGNI